MKQEYAQAYATMPEQYLLGVFYANDFNQRMGRVI